MILHRPQKQSWLILTDKQHLAIDAGFGLSELDKNIREVEDR